MIIHILKKTLAYNGQTNKTNIGPKIWFWITRNNAYFSLLFSSILINAVLRTALIKQYGIIIIDVLCFNKEYCKKNISY